MHPAYRYSGLARPVDPKHPTNRAVLILLGLGLLAGGIYGIAIGAPLTGVALIALNLGLTVFISWALTRELSPDDQVAAFVAVVLATIAWFRLGNQAILAPVTLLIALRLVNRTTGKAAERTDTFVVVLVFAAVAWYESWILGLIGAAAFALDALLPASPGQEPRPYHVGAALIVLTLTAFFLRHGLGPAVLPEGPLILAAITGLAVVVALLHPRPESSGDVDGLGLRRSRVRTALLLGVIGTVALTLDRGVALDRTGVLWACLAAVVVGRGAELLRRRD